MNDQDRADAFCGRLGKNIPLPPRPPRVGTAPSAMGMGDHHTPENRISGGRQREVNQQATAVNRDSGRPKRPSAEPIKHTRKLNDKYERELQTEVQTRDKRRGTERLPGSRPEPAHELERKLPNTRKAGLSHTVDLGEF